MDQKSVNPDSRSDSNEAAELSAADLEIQAAPVVESNPSVAAPVEDETDPKVETAEEKEPNALPSLLAWMLAIIVCAALLSLLAWQPAIARALAEQRITVLTPAYTPAENLDDTALAAMPVYVPT